jgi:GT2 family glycosyltransferase
LSPKCAAAPVAQQAVQVIHKVLGRAQATAARVMNDAHRRIDRKSPAGQNEPSTQVGVFAIHEIACVEATHLAKRLGAQKQADTGDPGGWPGRAPQASAQQVGQRHPIPFDIRHLSLRRQDGGRNQRQPRIVKTPQQIGQLQTVKVQIRIEHREKRRVTVGERRIVVRAEPFGLGVAHHNQRGAPVMPDGLPILGHIQGHDDLEQARIHGRQAIEHMLRDVSLPMADQGYGKQLEVRFVCQERPGKRAPSENRVCRVYAFRDAGRRVYTSGFDPGFTQTAVPAGRGCASLVGPNADSNMSPHNFESACLDLSLVTFNSERWLAPFFRSLLEQAFPVARINLLIRDNGSLDLTEDVIREFIAEHADKFRSVSFDAGQNIGFGRGHNANLARAQSDFFLVSNVDLVFEPDTLEILMREALSDPSEVACWECRQKPYEHPKDYNPVDGDTLWCSSACALFRREPLQAIGGYEPALFMYAEDVEVSYRLRANGFRLRYVPRASVWHYSYEDVGIDKPLQFFESTLGHVLLRCRYGSWGQVLRGLIRYLGLFFLRPRFPRQRWHLFKNSLRLLAKMPRFLLSRKAGTAEFGFRGWDYALAREGALLRQRPPKAGEPPLVSVITRTMPGCGARLREAMASVAGQTYRRIELVVVEDGGETAREQVDALRETGRLERVTHVPLPRSGRCKAGNSGLAAASGDLLCFLDDDDLFYADHLETLVAEWRENPDLAAVYGLGFEVQTEYLDKERWIYRNLIHSVIHRKKFDRAVLWHHNFMPIQCVLFRRDLYLQYGGFDTELENLEDWNLWVRYSLHQDFQLVPKVTSMYRVPADGALASSRLEELDRYYAVAQAKHAQLSLQISPPEILEIAKHLSRELYVTAIPVSTLRAFVHRHRWVARLYHPLRRFRALWREVRAR